MILEAADRQDLRNALQDGLSGLQAGFERCVGQERPEFELSALAASSASLRSLCVEVGLPQLGLFQHSLSSAFAVRAQYEQPIQDDEMFVCASVLGLLSDAVATGGDGDTVATILCLLPDIAWLPPLPTQQSQDLATRLAVEIASIDPSIADGDITKADVSFNNEAPVDAFDIDMIIEDAASAEQSQSAEPMFAIGDDALAPIGQQEDFAIGDEAVEGIGFEAEPASASVIDDASSLFAESDDPADAGDGAIWISPEELEMTRDALVGQCLPLAQQYAEEQDAQEKHRQREDFAYYLSLIGNAMDMLQLAQVGRGVNAMQQAMHNGAELPDEMPMQWCVELLTLFEGFDADACEAWIGTTLGLPGLDEAWLVQALDETSRVIVGLDPALLAARKTIAEPEDVTLQPADDVLANVLQSMLRELPGNAERLGAAVRAMLAGDMERTDEARRVAHTLKGDANTVGVRGLANLTHVLEDVMIALQKRPELLQGELPNFLQESVDTVEEIAEHLLGRGRAPSQLLDIYQQALNWDNLLAGDGAMGVPATSSFDAEPTPAARPSEAGRSETTEAPAAPADAPAEAEEASRQISVDSRLLDDLQRLAGEVLVTSRQVDQRITNLSRVYSDLNVELRGERNFLSQLDDLVALRGAALQSAALGDNEVDALELDQYNELHVVSRHLLESQADNVAHLQRIDAVLSELEDLRSSQERLHDELQRAVMRARRVPFREITPRLQRIVRQTTRQLLKPVNLEVSGDQHLVDADTLERIVEPLSHLLRNAVDHGIESAERREALGKSAEGHVHLVVAPVGDAMQVSVRDDGSGLDLDAIRTKAERLGLLKEDQHLEADAVSRLILLPGFSTRNEVTQTSGRGVGMDVVNQRINALRGTLRISSQAGNGTQMLIELPMSQSTANVVVARGQQVNMAATANSLRRIQRIEESDVVVSEDGQLQVRIDEKLLPAMPIESLFGISGPLSLPGNGGNLGLLVEDGFLREHVVFVREVGDIRSVVVKPISPLLPTIPAVRGMTQLGDGQLATVVDVGALIEARQSTLRMSAEQLRSAMQARPRVVVADDSLSVRRALEQLMEDAGYEVAAARDGLEALKMIEERTPVAVLLDLEMPRMNGLEVCQHLRNQSQTRETPVLMITSRASEKYQQMATQAGVTKLLGKPFVEDELVNLVRQLVAETSAS